MIQILITECHRAIRYPNTVAALAIVTDTSRPGFFLDLEALQNVEAQAL
jgi:hypothetical protein